MGNSISPHVIPTGGRNLIREDEKDPNSSSRAMNITCLFIIHSSTKTHLLFRNGIEISNLFNLIWLSN
jgi:hypothetical protein